jgi:hypothetical protein
MNVGWPPSGTDLAGRAAWQQGSQFPGRPRHRARARSALQCSPGELPSPRGRPLPAPRRPAAQGGGPSSPAPAPRGGGAAAPAARCLFAGGPPLGGGARQAAAARPRQAARPRAPLVPLRDCMERGYPGVSMGSLHRRGRACKWDREGRPLAAPKNRCCARAGAGTERAARGRAARARRAPARRGNTKPAPRTRGGPGAARPRGRGAGWGERGSGGSGRRHAVRRPRPRRRPRCGALTAAAPAAAARGCARPPTACAAARAP